MELLSRCAEFPKWPTALEGGVVEGICHLCTVGDGKGRLSSYCPARDFIDRGNDCSHGYWSVQKLICKHLSWICFCSGDGKKKQTKETPPTHNKLQNSSMLFDKKLFLKKYFLWFAGYFIVKVDAHNTTINDNRMLHKSSGVCLNTLGLLIWKYFFSMLRINEEV